MIQLIVFSSFLAIDSNAFSPRIVSGTNAVLGQVPYIVSLQEGESHFCGGSILDKTHVLTAAHCAVFGKDSKIFIQYGVIDRKSKVHRIRVIMSVYHEKYTPKNGHANDIAILTLETSIVFNPNVKPIVLPKQDEPIPENKVAILAGWGRDKTGGSIQNLLKVVNLKLYSDKECEEKNHQANQKYHLCSGVDEGGKGQCGADSGGPLYSQGKQVGIVSWSANPCAIKGRPGVYTRVASYVDWIKKELKN